MATEDDDDDDNDDDNDDDVRVSLLGGNAPEARDRLSGTRFAIEEWGRRASSPAATEDDDDDDDDDDVRVSLLDGNAPGANLSARRGMLLERLGDIGSREPTMGLERPCQQLALHERRRYTLTRSMRCGSCDRNGSYVGASCGSASDTQHWWSDTALD